MARATSGGQGTSARRRSRRVDRPPLALCALLRTRMPGDKAVIMGKLAVCCARQSQARREVVTRGAATSSRCGAGGNSHDRLEGPGNHRATMPLSSRPSLAIGRGHVTPRIGPRASGPPGGAVRASTTRRARGESGPGWRGRRPRWRRRANPRARRRRACRSGRRRSPR